MVPDGHVREHLDPLVGPADAHPGPLVGGQFEEAHAVELHRPAFGSELAADAVEQRGLAGAVRPDQADALPLPTSMVTSPTATIPPKILVTPSTARSVGVGDSAIVAHRRFDRHHR